MTAEEGFGCVKVVVEPPGTPKECQLMMVLFLLVLIFQLEPLCWNVAEPRTSVGLLDSLPQASVANRAKAATPNS